MARVLTHHRAAMLFVVSWALLLRPAARGDDPASTAQWEQAASFHSATACEAVRAEIIEAARRPLGDPWMLLERSEVAPVDQTISPPDSRCVPR
jgi:hypothetical protein